MELSLVATLIESYKAKTKVFDNFRILIKPIRRVLKEGSPYDDEFQALVFKKMPFLRSYGFLPAVERLIALNEELINYRSEIGLDMEKNLAELVSRTPENSVVMQAYSKAAELLKKEQHYLVNFLKPTLIEIHNRGKYKESWEKVLVSFENFMLLFNAELKRFEILLNELRKRELLKQGLEALEAKRNEITRLYVNGLAAGDFVYLTGLLNNTENRRWFGSEEINFMLRLADAIKSEDIEVLGSLLKTKIFAQIFEAEHYIDFFRSVLDGLSERLAAAPEQLERRLASEAEELERLRERARQALYPDIFREVVEEIKEVKEVIPEVRKFKKSGLRRLKARFRLARRKLGWKFMNRKAISVLKKAESKRKWATEELRARKARIIQARLSEERRKLEAVAEKLKPYIRTRESVQEQVVTPTAEELWVNIIKPENGAVFGESTKEIKFIAETNLDGTGYMYRWLRLKPDGIMGEPVGGDVTRGKDIGDAIERRMFKRFDNNTHTIIVRIYSARKGAPNPDITSNKITIKIN